MTSAVAPPVASSAKVGDEASPLICAPCYVCLEGGPDEKGQPLIRSCSCRGESSAGYHLSCIINYAKVKTKQAVQDYEAGGDYYDSHEDNWAECANCKLPYKEPLCIELAKEMVAHVASLVSDPETHHLHFEARKAMAGMLPKKEAQDEMKSLLSLWGERKSDFLHRWQRRKDIDKRDQTIFYIEEKYLLLYWLGEYQLQDEDTSYQQALETWEQALETRIILKSLRAYDDRIDSEIQHLERQIRYLKDPKGSRAEREEELRQNIKDSSNENDHQWTNQHKHILARLLLVKEPPEYEEAISLLKESSEGWERILGPGHQELLVVQNDLLQAKEEYEEHLASTDDSNGDHARS